MVTIEQKIKLFSKLIYQDVDNDIKDKVKQFNEKKAAMLEQAEAEAREKARNIYNTNENRIKRKINELMTLSKIENRKRILEVKEECIQRMITKLEERAKTFTNTPGYDVYMDSCLKKITRLMGEGNSLQVFVTNEDMQKFKELFDKSNVSVNYTKDNIIGGIVAVDIGNHTRLDLSIRTRLEDMRPFVINRLMKELGEVGDDIE